MKRFVLLALLSGVLISILGAAPSQAQAEAIRSPHLGINHISAPNDPIADQRYRNALLLGAGWNRYPLYWDAIETSAGSYDWQSYDVLVANDVRYGLRTDAILLGIPKPYDSNGRIPSLYQPIFSDGTDIPSDGKLPNPANPYASFVYAAVMRYKPGGTLAARLGWQPEQGIRVWEAWNEPDLAQFWRGSVQDYARLLKVTYLVTHHADALAQVMFAGLAYLDPNWNDYLARTLAEISFDPLRTTYNWYFDIAAVHSYTVVRLSGQVVARIKQVLAAYRLDRPVWLNESGVPVWDDYPGPTWTAGNPYGHLHRLTQEEQALYVVESTALAWAAGADVVFIFQLYDDCGNQPNGTDFPPDSGQAGDAYGMFRNDRSAPCFRQSPQPNTPRPAAAALTRMAQVFGSRQMHGGTQISLNERGTVIAFDLSPLQSVTQSSGATVTERAYVMWNNSRSPLAVEVPASSESAQLYDIASSDYPLAPQAGDYNIGLPAVTASDYPLLTSSEVAQVSGAPYILVEQVPPGETPVDARGVRISGEAAPLQSIVEIPTVTAPVVLATLPVLTPTPQPMTDPALDRTPPIPIMLPLPAVSSTTFTVRWDGLDNGAIAAYIVWVRVNGGDWQQWLETPETQADFSGTPGTLYEFALWAVDRAGNWSQNIELTPLAVTRAQ